MRTVVCFVFAVVFPMSAAAEKPVEYPNVHQVDVVFPHDHPILKEERVEVPAAERKSGDQGYQAACRHGNINRCSGVDLANMDSALIVDKKAADLPVIERPVPRTFATVVMPTPKADLPAPKKHAKRR